MTDVQSRDKSSPAISYSAPSVSHVLVSLVEVLVLQKSMLVLVSLIPHLTQNHCWKHLVYPYDLRSTFTYFPYTEYKHQDPQRRCI